MSEVCPLLNPAVDLQALVHTVNLSNEKSLQKYSQQLSNCVYTSQPTLTICLLTRITEEIYHYGCFSYFLQSLFASQHNFEESCSLSYLMLPLYLDSSDDDYQYHRKLAPILEIMTSTQHHCDYVVWLDADLVLLDLAWRIETLIFDSPHTHLYLSQDVSTLVNTGGMIIRNSYWSQQFVQKWIDRKTVPHIHNEQMGFSDLYDASNATEREKIQILPIHVLNSEAPPMWKQLPHHKVLHLAAESNHYRREVFRAIAEEICSTRNVWTPQLGITRRKLQTIAIQVYGEMVTTLEAVIANSPTIFAIPLSELTDYRTTVSKYCFALAYAEREVQSCRMSSSGVCEVTIPTSRKESKQTLQLRMRGYHLLRDVVEALCFIIIQLASPVVVNSIKSKSSPSTATVTQPQVMDYLTRFHQYVSCRDESPCMKRDLRTFHRLRGLLQIPEDYDWFAAAFKNSQAVSNFLYEEVYRDDHNNGNIANPEMIYQYFQHLPEMMKQSIELSYETLHILLENLLTREDDTLLSPESMDGYQAVIVEIVEYLNFVFPLLLHLLRDHPLRGMIESMYQEYQQFHHYSYQQSNNNNN